VYIPPGRCCWLALAGVALVLCFGCQESPPQRGTLGNLPSQLSGSQEPQINAPTYFAHGHLLERQGQFERAAAQYCRALALQPQLVAARNRLGITLNKLGRHAEATQQFRQALVERPATAYLHNNLGFSLYLEGNYKQAEAALVSALELKPDFARAHMNYALVLAHLGRFDEAFGELTRVGGEADASFNMGILLTEAGQYAEAASYLEAALVARPDFDAARQQLQEVTRLAAEQQARQEALAAVTHDTVTDAEPTEEWTEDEESTGEFAAEAPLEDQTLELPAEPAPLEVTPEQVAETPTDADETEFLVEQEPAEQFAQEPGIDTDLLFALIDEAITELHDGDFESYDELWCQVEYYLFPDTAPDRPESASHLLMDQRDVSETVPQRPIGK
jgi:Flp pilus assembly protein TadD